MAGLGNLERFLSNKWSLGFSVRWRGQGVGLAEVEEGGDGVWQGIIRLQVGKEGDDVEVK